MALQISKGQLVKAHSRLEALKTRLGSLRQRTEAATERAIGTVETTSAAFLAGVMQGKTGGIEVFGMPIELLAGAGLNAMGYFGAAGKHSDHLINFGDGFLSAYACTVGRGVGQAWNEKQLRGGEEAKGVRGVTMTPSEMATAAAQAAQQGAR